MSWLCSCLGFLGSCLFGWLFVFQCGVCVWDACVDFSRLDFFVFCLFQHLHDENWTKEETDHLFDLANLFDLRFVIMQDRYDTEKYTKR